MGLSSMTLEGRSCVTERSRATEARGCSEKEVVDVSSKSQVSHALGLRVGEAVEVRSAEEILATLDEHGCLDSLPFMPEMLQFCNKRFTVYKRADKTCDTIGKTGGRRLF